MTSSINLYKYKYFNYYIQIYTNKSHQFSSYLINNQIIYIKIEIYQYKINKNYIFIKLYKF